MPTKIETKAPDISPVVASKDLFYQPGKTESIYADTLSYAEEKAPEWRPEKPKLTPPSQMSYSVPKLLAVTATSQDLGNALLDSMGVRLSTIKQEIKEISAEMVQKLKEAAKRANESGFWAILKKIATCVLSAISAILGISLISSGAGVLVGGAMLASGVLSLANFALAESGAWDIIAKQIAVENEDLREKLQIILPAAVGSVAAVIGAVGSVNAIVQGAVDWAAKGALIAQSLLTLFDVTTTLSGGIANARLLWTEADLIKLRGNLTLLQELFDTTVGAIRGSIDYLESVEKKAKRAIDMAAESSNRLSGQV